MLSLLLCSFRRCLQNGIQVNIKAIYANTHQCCRHSCRQRWRADSGSRNSVILLSTSFLCCVICCVSFCICVPKFSFMCVSSCMTCEKPCNVISSLVFLPPLFAKWHPSQHQGYLCKHTPVLSALVPAPLPPPLPAPLPPSLPAPLLPSLPALVPPSLPLPFV